MGIELSGGMISNRLKKIAGISTENQGVFSITNVEKIVQKLSKMRGAALKLGQMLSIQGILL